MATYFVSSGGSNTSPYDTWAKAATSLQTALTAASTAGDVVVIQYDGVPTTDNTLAADTNYTFSANIFLVSASNDGGSAYTPTEMGTTYFIGSSTTSLNLQLLGVDRAIKVWGVTFRIGGALSKEIRMSGSSGMSCEFENCYFWLGSTNGACVIRMIQSFEASAGYRNCTFRFASTAHALGSYARARLIDCTLDSAGSVPSQLFTFSANTGTQIYATGCDFSHCTNTIVPNFGTESTFEFERCIFGTGATLFASQTSNPTRASAKAFFSDCLVGSTRTWGYYDALGSAVRETGIYYTGSEAGNESWKIVTTANANTRNPFRTIWVDWYNTGTSAITPRFEILRDGSTTAFKDSEVWAEFSYKNTASSPIADGYATDGDALADILAGTAGTDQAAGAGLGSWTGESGTAWSGKIDSGSSITPTEAGYLRGRIAVAAASATLYVDPVIRTA